MDNTWEKESEGNIVSSLQILGTEMFQLPVTSQLGYRHYPICRQVLPSDAESDGRLCPHSTHQPMAAAAELPQKDIERDSEPDARDARMAGEKRQICHQSAASRDIKRRHIKEEGLFEDDIGDLENVAVCSRSLLENDEGTEYINTTSVETEISNTPIIKRLCALEDGQNTLAEAMKKIIAGQELILSELKKRPVVPLRRPPWRPPKFPMTNVQDYVNIAAIDDTMFNGLVTFYSSLGGSSLKEVVSTCFKESISDDLATQITWLGKDDKEALSTSKLTLAIYEATKDNRPFDTPKKAEFKIAMMAALKAARERARNRRKSQRDIWDDD